MLTNVGKDSNEAASFSVQPPPSSEAEIMPNMATSSTPSASNALGRDELEEIMQMKIVHLFRTLEPFIHQLDQHVIAVRTSQELLNQELESLLVSLAQLSAYDLPASMSALSVNSTGSVGSLGISAGRISNDITIDLEDKSRRLLGLKRRLTLVHSILSTVNSRVKKLLLAHNARILASNASSELATNTLTK